MRINRRSVLKECSGILHDIRAVSVLQYAPRRPSSSIPRTVSLPQVLNLVQSYVTLRVPLHVSYVFHSPVAVGGWQHFDLQSELKLTFVYDTAILWQDGIGSPPEAELQGTCRFTVSTSPSYLLGQWCVTSFLRNPTIKQSHGHLILPKILHYVMRLNLYLNNN